MFVQKAMTDASSGSNVLRPPIEVGDAKLREMPSRMPYGRKTSASLPRPCMFWGLSCVALAFTLLTMMPLTRIEARSRAYSAARERSLATNPSLLFLVGFLFFCLLLLFWLFFFFFFWFCLLWFVLFL